MASSFLRFLFFTCVAFVFAGVVSFLGVVLVVPHLFSTDWHSSQINVTSRPGGRSVIFRVVNDGFGESTEFFVKDKSGVKKLITWGDDIAATRVYTVRWSKDGTLLIINDPDNPTSGKVAYDFRQRCVLDRTDMPRIVKSRGGKGQILVEGQRAIGALRPASSEEQAELEHAETYPYNAF